MRFLFPLVALLCAASIAPVGAQTIPSKTSPLESKSEARALVQRLLREGKIMRASDARRGMIGISYSVFQGVKIEKFRVAILGTLEKVQGGGDLVMMRVLDGPVVERNSGIIQGMSGSPVYINGKLLGAIAIGFGFPKEPIGGITPITQMIETGLPDRAFQVAPAPTGTRAAPTQKSIARGDEYRTSRPFAVAGRPISRVVISKNSALPHFIEGGLTMRPCTRVLMLSGVSSAGLERWRRSFEPLGVTPILGGGQMSAARAAQVFGISSKKLGAHAGLQPGAGIGVQLASGDIDATGIGTVTFRDGNRVLAFGHPMFNLGGVSMPMTTAFIHDIFPAYDISFKLGSALQEVGELQRDNNFSVGGTVGKRAQTLPLRIRIRDADKKIDRRINCRLVKDPLFTPLLLQNIATEAAQSTLGLDSDKTVRVSLSMKLVGGQDIVRQNTIYAGGVVFESALEELLDAISITQQNPFQKAAFSGVSLDIQVIQGRKTALIRRIFADRNRVKAGDKVTVSVAIEPTNKPGQEIIKRFVVAVPADAPRGVLRLVVSPAELYWAGHVRVGGAPPRPGTLPELLEAYDRVGSRTELLLQASTPRRFLLLDRKKVANPPALWNVLIGQSPSTSVASFNETVEQRQSSEYVLDGLEALVLPVESRRVNEGNASELSGTAGLEVASEVGADPDPAVENEENNAVLAPSTNGRLKEIEWQNRQKFWLARLGLKRVEQLPAKRQSAQTPAIVPLAKATPDPKATPSATPTPTSTSMPPPDAGAGSIARPVGQWVQRTAADFSRGTFRGAVVNQNGTISAGPTSRLLLATGEPIAWSVARSGSTIWMGTGNGARLLQIRGRVSKTIYEGPEVAVSALQSDGKGGVFAGVSPGGRVYHFNADGQKTIVLQTRETFIHALALEGDVLWVATGGERGAVYKLSLGSQMHASMAISDAVPFCVFGQKHARSLAPSGGDLLVGTGNDAVLYRVSASGQASALFQVTIAAQELRTASPANTTATAFNSQPAQTIVIISGAANPANAGNVGAESGDKLPALALSSDNEILAVQVAGDSVYFGTLRSGSVWKYTAKNDVQEIWKGPGRAIYALRYLNDALYAATDGGQVWRLELGDEVRAERILDATQTQVLALDAAPERVLAATANNAALYEIATLNGAPTFVSSVLDAGQIVRFGALRWIGNGVSLETRSGNTFEPDATWSEFVPLQNPDEASGQIASPVARFFQYRATLRGDGTLSRVATLYRAPNRAPRVEWSLPLGGEFLSGRKTLAWNASDPDSDPLRAVVALLPNGAGKTAIQLQLPTGSSLELDSKQYPDGLYSATVTVSDGARNPGEALTSTRLSQPFILDNTAPQLRDVKIAKTAAGWTLSALTQDATSPLAGAEWRVIGAKTGDATSVALATSESAKPVLWQALGALDGIFDNQNETLTGEILPLNEGVAVESGARIEVRSRDAAGNSVTAAATVP